MINSIITQQDYNIRLDLNDEESRNYFGAKLLPQSKASELQNYLDTYGSVKLEAGDYSAAGNIVMKSHQRLYGFNRLNTFGNNITISEGSSYVYIDTIKFNDLIFEAGDPITNCTFVSIEDGRVLTTGGRLHSNTFVNIVRCRVYLDCSVSGYLRNNLFIKLRTQSWSPQTELEGNDDEPSYGNLEVARNILTPHGDGGVYDNLKNHNIVGIDSETWNYSNQGTRAAVSMTDMGEVLIAGYSGAHFGPTPTPALDVEADKVLLIQKVIEKPTGEDSIIRTNTDVLSLGGRSETFILEDDASSFDVVSKYNTTSETEVNGTSITTTLTGQDKGQLSNLLDTVVKSPVPKPVYDDIINVTGDNWSTDRVGKTSQTAFIQSLIDTNGIAELDEGIYYIDSSLIVNKGEGIVGKGKNKTIIVGITDDFPLINATNNGELATTYYFSHFTLQGGNAGIEFTHEDSNLLQVTLCDFNQLCIRDTVNGMYFNQFYGFDNNLIRNVDYINCTRGVYQYVDPSYVSGENDTMMYIDKVMWYKCRFIDCGIGLSMLAKRADNLNCWIDCEFDGNGVAAELDTHIGGFFANSTFKNSTGDYVIEGNGAYNLNLFNCDFIDNTVNNSIFRYKLISLDGCTFNEDIELMDGATGNVLIACNSEITGEVGDLFQGVFMNSTSADDSTLSNKFVTIENSVNTIIIDEPSVPVPQLYTISNTLPALVNHFQECAALAGSSSTNVGTWDNNNQSVAVDADSTDGSNALRFTNVGGSSCNSQYVMGGFEVGDTFNVYFDYKADTNGGSYAGNFEVTVRNPSTAAKLDTTGVMSSNTHGATYQPYHLTGTLETTELGLRVSMTSSGDVGDSSLLDNVRIYVNQSE